MRSNRTNHLLDDLTGLAGGLFAAVTAVGQEAKAVAQDRMERFVDRCGLVKREELEVAMELARRAAERAEALEKEVAALKSAP
jgi:BMFP domain-containing protein YqiC